MFNRELDRHVKAALNNIPERPDPMMMVKQGYAMGAQTVVQDVLGLVKCGALSFHSSDNVPEAHKRLYLLLESFERENSKPG